MEIVLKSADIAYLNEIEDYSKCHVIVANADEPSLSWKDVYRLAPILADRIEIHEAATHDSELFILGGLINRDDVTVVNMGAYESYAKQFGNKAKFVTWIRKDSVKKPRKKTETKAKSKVKGEDSADPETIKMAAKVERVKEALSHKTEISEKTLSGMDNAVKNLREGNVSEAINPPETSEKADNKEESKKTWQERYAEEQREMRKAMAHK